ncbi:MAG: hypothetical protein ABH983_05950 [Candidatus Micrarchaeota archaeon]
MVERHQRIAPGKGLQKFEIWNSHPSNYSQKHFQFPSSLFYHIFKFQALRYARSLFPSNFISARELRISGSSCNTYSDFVPDETGVIRRQTTARSMFDLAPETERHHVVEQANAIERELNPELLKLIKKFKSAGLTLAHPESNFHVSSGNTVFFEVTEIDIEVAFNYLFKNHPTDPEAHANFVLFLATSIKYLAGIFSDADKTGGTLSGCCDEYTSIDLSELFDIFQYVCGTKNSLNNFSTSNSGLFSDYFRNILTVDIDYFRDIAPLLFPRQLQPMPYEVDQRIFDPRHLS